jgi:hypothetical protein
LEAGLALMSDMKNRLKPSVIAIAGRRIDAKGAKTKRFPLEAVEPVAAELDALFVREHAVALVSSAACGADLIALDVAGRRGLRRRIILPSAPEVFIKTSVTDRPGDWRPLYERIIADARDAGDLVVARPPKNRSDPYCHISDVIIAEACRSAAVGGPTTRKLAVVVWDGQPRGGSDVTDYFRRTALEKRFELREVLTLPQRQIANSK